MDLNKTGKAVSTPLLFLLEYGFKFLAGVAAAIALAAKGSFFEKLGAAVGSLLPAIQQLTNAPAQAAYLGQVIEDYNTMTAATFNQRYGGQAINNLLDQLNEGVAYFQAIYQNLVQQPFATIFAALLIFLVLYLLGRICRFTRQRGQGSYVNRVERRLGDRVFRSSKQPGPDQRDNLKQIY
ncbi:hypothetical protein NC796_10815 [Aliifodinibius sp. S!AR15-10]|uniref:hypothetical protein n=1 Tax=Aliifodinibius sp. S!AR15-10 TaxID=2950437 RepID=UPI002865F274|nr:hypothetical protein [Aliifodinibius sp. S!AR15-10]MDR8391635.1 hypothetical protein [Aliifodinibius sp. S!AR15-10]